MSNTEPTQPLTEDTVVIDKGHTAEAEIDAPRRKVGIGYLVTGLIFLGIVTMWWLGTADLISANDLSLAGPIVLIAAGGLGLAATVFNRNKEGA